MEAIFLKTIQDEPGNSTHPLIYADWLEEQGNPKAELVRLWQQAVHGQAADRAAASRQLRRHQAALPDLYRLLSKQQKRLLACDCAERVVSLIGTEVFGSALSSIREGLDASRLFAGYKLGAKSLQQHVRSMKHLWQTRPDRVIWWEEAWRFQAWQSVEAAIQGHMHALDHARRALGEDQMYQRPAHWAIAHLNFAPEYQCQYLLGWSYHLFDCSCPALCLNTVSR